MNIGTYRGLSSCGTKKGTFSILALDHRGSLKRALNPSSPASVPHKELVELKNHIVSNLAPHSSAVLLDPEIGSGAAIASGSMPGDVGMLVALEKSGYTGSPSARESQILPAWSVNKIKRMGASGVKLLVYYHPDSPKAAQQEALVSKVAEECQKYDLPLFLEPLTYSLDPAVNVLPTAKRRQNIIRTAQKLTPLGADILKVEFPVDVKQEQDHDMWFEACEEMTAASQIPWTLLSAGVDFETFIKQVEVACRAGASGVLAGRAVWKEAVELKGEERSEFLRTTADERMTKLKELCDELARPWTQVIPPPDAGEGWYREYPEM